MFHDLDVPRCEEQYADYIGKWFVVNTTYAAFLTHSGKNVSVESLDKDNLDIFFWDDEIDALRDMEMYYDNHGRTFPYANVLAALDGCAPSVPDAVESEVMRFD